MRMGINNPRELTEVQRIRQELTRCLDFAKKKAQINISFIIKVRGSLNE